MQNYFHQNGKVAISSMQSLTQEKNSWIIIPVNKSRWGNSKKFSHGENTRPYGIRNSLKNVSNPCCMLYISTLKLVGEEGHKRIQFYMYTSLMLLFLLPPEKKLSVNLTRV